VAQENVSLGRKLEKFSEIANRLTGISTPLVGVPWQPTDLEVSAARLVITYLEDRRVLYAPDELEVPSHCVQAVLEIRQDGKMAIFSLSLLIRSRESATIWPRLRV
jgi:hypothetical protein